MMKRIAETVTGIARIVAGLVFVFSGFVKSVDPAGSAIKFDEYFSAFGMEFLHFTTFPLAILLSSLEFLIGVCLVFAIRIREAAWGALIFMLIFLPLTLILAIFNPVTDCGCFGDALVLTNWETFYKNLVIIAPVIVVFLRRKTIQPWLRPATAWGTAFLIVLFPVLINIYSHRHLPVIDFRPYRVGTYLPDKMSVPNDAPIPEFETILVYEKNGKKQEFTLDDYPWQDSTWTWVETISKPIGKLYIPPIHDFSITSASGEDITQSVLSSNKMVFLVVSPDPVKADEETMKGLNELYLQLTRAGHEFYFLTSASSALAGQIQMKYHLLFPLFFTDETALKTMNRANPGMIALREGTVLAQWHYNDFPDAASLAANPLALILDRQSKRHDITIVVSLALSLLLIITVIRLLTLKKNERQ